MSEEEEKSFSFGTEEKTEKKHKIHSLESKIEGSGRLSKVRDTDFLTAFMVLVEVILLFYGLVLLLGRFRIV